MFLILWGDFMNVEEMKKVVVKEVFKFIEDEMVVGFGIGLMIVYFINYFGKFFMEGEFEDVYGVLIFY